jgi:surfeit locus 1 family protein
MTPVAHQASGQPTRPWLVWLAAAISAGLMVSLGCWQLRRAAQKQAAYTQLQSRQHLPAWTNVDWPCRMADEAKETLPQQRPVALKGEWLAEHTVFLDNRPMDGASGFIVVTPLRLAASGSACAGRVVLVERGWVPRDAHDRLHLPAVPTPRGEVQVVGRVQSALSQAYQLGEEPNVTDTQAPLVRQNAGASFWATWLGQAPLVGAVLQVQAEAPITQAASGVAGASVPVLRRHWPEPGQGQDKHLAYAAQWFAMAAAIAALTLWYQVIRPRRSSLATPHVHV